MSDNCFWTNEVGCIELCAQGPAYVLVTPDDLPVDGLDTNPYGFGDSAAMSGDFVVVGHPSSDATYDNGRALAFERSGESWVLSDTLVPSWDGSESDGRFGSKVAADGDYFVVAAEVAKRVCVFHRSGGSWTEQASLQPAGVDENTVERFAEGDLAIAGDYLIVGAYNDDDGTYNFTGAAYVYSRSGGTWSQAQKLKPAGLAPDGRFGVSVAMFGDLAIIGAERRIGGSSSEGVAYIFRRSGGTYALEAELLASDRQSYEYFGEQVAITDDYAFVSAISGLYVFERSGSSWIESYKFTSPIPGPSGVLWLSSWKEMVLSGNLLFISGNPAPDAQSVPVNEAVFVFEKVVGGSWEYRETLVGPTYSMDTEFANDLSLSGNTIFASKVDTVPPV
ncbi:MAG: hypothetical protein CME38_01220 [Haliea sp.]|nr:hypothetical protein [Haliea sp.]|tara:strand:+ start:649 stop:1824 length:1176 start_codon:yes stop_codon:yes gene_type:complete